MWRYPAVFLLVSGLLACSGAKTKPDVHGGYLSKVGTVDYSAHWGVRFNDYGVDRFAKLSPLVESNVVYSADNKGNVNAIDLTTGERKWSVVHDFRFSAGPTSSDRCLFLATRNAEVLCVSRESGEIIWTSSVSSEALSPPVSGQGVVIVQAGDGSVTGLSAEDGARLWTYDRRVPPLSLRGTGQPVIVDDTVLAGFANGKLVGLSIHDGKTLWESSVATPRGRTELERMVDIDGMFHYDGNAIYVVSYHGRIAAMTLESGRLLWTRDMSSYLGLNLDSKYLYVSDEEGRIWALDKENGATLWMQDKLSGRAATAPVVTEKHILVGAADGSLYWLNKADGAVLSKLSYKQVAEVTGVINPADVGSPEGHPALVHRDDFGVVSATVSLDSIVVAYRNGVISAFTANW